MQLNASFFKSTVSNIVKVRKMKCKKVKRMISLYMDGELKPDNEKKLFEHLETCESCRKEKNLLECINQMLLPPKEIQPSPQFLFKLKQKITSPKTIDYYTASLLKYLKPVLVSMACILIFVISFVLGNSLGTQLKEKETPGKRAVIETFNNIMDISVFDNIPRDSFAFAYFNLFQDKKK
jgi:predicted anti-sigma-YlaC factor YlaD